MRTIWIGAGLAMLTGCPSQTTDVESHTGDIHSEMSDTGSDSAVPSDSESESDSETDSLPHTGSDSGSDSMSDSSSDSDSDSTSASDTACFGLDTMCFEDTYIPIETGLESALDTYDLETDWSDSWE